MYSFKIAGIKLTPRVYLVTMYNKIICFTLRSVISCLILLSFDFDNSISSFVKNFPAKRVNVVQSVIVANAKNRLVDNFLGLIL